MDDILSRIASFARNSPPVQTTSAATKYPASFEFVETAVCQQNSPYRLQTAVSAHFSKSALLCFSKDRPYQLEQFLISSQTFLSLDKIASKIFVLYSPGSFESNYNGVFARHPYAVPVKETEEGGFPAALLHCLDLILDVVGNSGTICFCVDDLIFIDNIDLSHLGGVLTTGSGSRTLGLHLKLHPGVTYSHAAGQICYPPILEGPRHLFEDGRGVTCLEYEHSGCTGDWKYALDLCAGLYRVCDIRFLTRKCVESHGLNSIRNPNVLEVSLNKAYWESQNRDLPGSRYSSSIVPSTAPPQDSGVSAADASSDVLLTHLPQYTRSGCLSAPCVKVVTVNRVQSTYVVPTFITPGGDIQTLNALCGGVEVKCNSHVLDFSKYASETSLSAHVGSWHLVPSSSSSSSRRAQPSAREGEGEGEGGQGDAVGKLDLGHLDACANFDKEKEMEKEEEEGCALLLPGSVCVLIPVRNGQEHLTQCLRSLLTQPQGCLFKILLVDDGSTDGTMDIALSIADEVKRGVFSTSNPGASMDIVNAGRIGLAAALDRGIALSGTVYIARLDSDDICEAGRLKRQKDYLDRHKDIHVLGGQAIVIGKNSYTAHNNTSSSSSGSATLAGSYQTLPALVHWGMFFRCCIMHPSVMFRRDIVQECGSYSNIASKEPHTLDGEGPDDINVVKFTEDYALWLRILERYPYSVCNLPHVVIRLRKHDDSKSALQATALTTASDIVRWGLVQHTLKIKDKSSAPHSLNNEKDCNHKHSRHSVYIPSKRHLDCLVHPSQHVHIRRDAEEALTMLGKLYQAYISQFKSYNISLLKLFGIDPMAEEEGCEYDALGQQGVMIRDLLQDAMVTSGKKVYQAGRLDAVVTKPFQQDVNISLECKAKEEKEAEEGWEGLTGEDSHSHSTGVEDPIPWENPFYPDDWMKIKTVAGADIMRGLFDLNI